MIAKVLLVVLLSLGSVSAQIAQQLRGQLREQTSGRPINNARVSLIGKDVNIASVSDHDGNFILEKIPPGYYGLVVNHLNYEPYYEPELRIEASKSPYRVLYLHERVKELAEVVVTSSDDLMPAVNRREFTVSQTQRYPATFFDPARLIVSQPGISQANDQANHVVLHGLSPEGIQWRIEGVPVLNPNHLSNAGTRRDRSSLSGGGVNILSGQLMDNSAFWTGALPPRFGNAFTGVFDIQLRPGNLHEREHTLQAGLLGIDFSTEGPLQKGKSSYLLNYRYSTVGLLGKLGVDFGGEEIQYQDFSANLHFNDSPMGRINIFIMAGSNSNELTPLDSAEWKEDKNRQNIFYKGRMGAIGLSQSATLGSGYRWQNGVAFSFLDTKRTESWLGPRQPIENMAQDHHEPRQLSAYSRVLHTLSSKIDGEAGLQVISKWSEISVNPMPHREAELNEQVQYLLAQPYFQLNYKLKPTLDLSAGLRFSYLNLSNSSRWEPYTKLIWQLHERHRLQMHYSRQSQVYSDFQLARRDEASALLDKLLDSHYLGFAWSYRLNEKTVLWSELFYQQLQKVPASASDLTINYLTTAYLPIQGLGSANTYGVDVSLNRTFQNDWYYQWSGSLFNSTYEGTNGQRHQSPFNSKWVVSTTGGKEWTKEKTNEQRSIGAHIRFLSRGGYHYTPINEAESVAQQAEVLEFSTPYSKQLPSYFSLDLRLSHTRQKTGYTRIWSLDIQNLTAKKNIGWYYSDFLGQTTKEQLQLGIIPVIAYRIQF